MTPRHGNNRRKDSTTQYWTGPYVPGKKLAEKPVFLLTSRQTSSGAEEFLLQPEKPEAGDDHRRNRRRRGASGLRPSYRRSFRRTFARAINPITKTNWEGTGVEPDVKASASDALDVAKKMAVEQIQKDQAARK